ncbi:hypothetical protein [Burkholderia sp.]|nr:hypothetical protein [Burkholderia sp.]
MKQAPAAFHNIKREEQELSATRSTTYDSLTNIPGTCLARQ